MLNLCILVGTYSRHTGWYCTHSHQASWPSCCWRAPHCRPPLTSPSRPPGDHWGTHPAETALSPVNINMASCMSVKCRPRLAWAVCSIFSEKSYFFLTRVSWRVNFLTFVLPTTPGEELEQLYPRHRQEFAPFCKEFVHCGEMRPSGGIFLTFSR